MTDLKRIFLRILVGILLCFSLPVPALPFAKVAISHKVQAKLPAALPEKGKAFKDPLNGVTFTLPTGFKVLGTYTRGKDHKDVLMRAENPDKVLFVYTSNRAKMRKPGSTKEEPFYSKDVMLEITRQTYLAEAKEKDIPVHSVELTKAGKLECVHILQEEDGKLSDRYFFGDRKNLYTLSFLVSEKDYASLKPAIAKSLETVTIPTPYEQLSIPGSKLTFEIPYGGMDMGKNRDPGDPHKLMYLHLDEKLMSGVIYEPLIQYMEYAYLPDSLDHLSQRDKENLCKVMTENRKQRWLRDNPGSVVEKSDTYFTEASHRPCIVEETVSGGRKSLGYIFVDKGMFLSLDFLELGSVDNKDVIDHVVNSLKKAKSEK